MREQYNKWSFCSQSATTHRVYRCLDKFTPFSGAASPEVRCLADRNLHCCCGVKECIFLRKLSADNHFLIPTTYRSERSLHSLRDDGEKSLTWEFRCLCTMLLYLRCWPPSQQNAINPALLISLGRGFRQVIDSSSGRLLELRTQKIMR